MKKFLTIVFVIASLAATAQQYQALDFFFPKKNVNKSSYENPGTSFKGNIWYLQDDQHTVYTVNHQFSDGSQGRSQNTSQKVL